MFDTVLEMPLDHLNCFSIVLREIHRKVDICQTYYSIHSKQRIFPYSKVIHGSTTFKLTKGQQGLKKNNQILNLVFCSSFYFLRSNVPDKKFHKQKWYLLFFTCIKVVAHVLVSTVAIAYIKWRRRNNMRYLTYLQYTDLAKADSQ